MTVHLELQYASRAWHLHRPSAAGDEIKGTPGAAAAIPRQLLRFCDRAGRRQVPWRELANVRLKLAKHYPGIDRFGHFAGLTAPHPRQTVQAQM